MLLEKECIPVVSIIIPVYNTLQYLRKCLDSLLGQTYSNLEIIIINDGSTDNSLDICEKYANKDQRIKIFSQSNKGISGARNTGLENASGEWLLFVDSDDWIELDAIEGLVAMLTKYPEVDLIRSFNREVDEKSNFSRKSITKNEQLYTRNEFLKSNLLGGYISSLFVKRSIVENNEIRFEIDLIVKEDLVFSWQCTLNSNNVLVNYNSFYNYFVRETSLIRTMDFKKVMNSLTAAELVYNYGKRNHSSAIMSVVYKKYLNPQLLDFIIGLVNIEKSQGKTKSPQQVRKILINFVRRTKFSLFKMNFKTFSFFTIAVIDYRLVRVLKNVKST